MSLGDQGNIVVQKLAQLNAAVTAARMERLEKQALYEQLERIQESGAPLDTFTPILNSSFIQGLKADLAGMQRERAQLTERLGDAHPDMIKINTSIASAERRLKDEMAKITEGIENDYIAVQARERAMTQALETQKREVLELSQKSIGFSALQRDAASTQQMFETVLQRVKETELSGGLQSNNAKILDRAEVPRSAIWPRKQLNLIVAMLGGAFVAVALAFGVEYLNPRIARAGDIGRRTRPAAARHGSQDSSASRFFQPADPSRQCSRRRSALSGPGSCCRRQPARRESWRSPAPMREKGKPRWPATWRRRWPPPIGGSC